MANILIVSGSYFPNATANTAVVREFEKELIKHGHSVCYAIERHDIFTPKQTEQNGIQVYHTDRGIDLFYKTCENLKTVNMPQPLKFMFKTGLVFIKSVLNLYAKIFYGSQRAFSEKCYLKEYANTIKKIVDKKDIDTVISVSVPFLSHKAVLKYLNLTTDKKIKWITYMIDSYSQKPNADNKSLKIKEELEIIEKSDLTIFLSTLKKEYSKEPFAKYISKIRFLDLNVYHHYSE